MVPGLTRSTWSYSTQRTSSVDAEEWSCFSSPLIAAISSGKSANDSFASAIALVMVESLQLKVCFKSRRNAIASRHGRIRTADDLRALGSQRGCTVGLAVLRRPWPHQCYEDSRQPAQVSTAHAAPGRLYQGRPPARPRAAPDSGQPGAAAR